jgi:hypothetical protein
LDKCTYNRDIVKKEKAMMYFIFSNEDGSVIIRADSEEDAIKAADEYDMEWDTVTEAECYDANEE